MGLTFPIPKEDETLEQYTVRCAAEAGRMDPDEFNDAVWSTWHSYRGPTEEEQLAQRHFSPERYHHVPGICVFAEHETTTSRGEKRKYKLKDLARIVRGNNDRISDVGAFPALSDGHTSNPGDANQREPKILGYAGNFRLGRIGRKKPRWAIFQDEYQLKDAAPVLQDKPRRSVELWTFNDGRAHFDPIAAIGAEAPRLPLPQRFQHFAHDGAEIERYTFQAGAFASPGAGSTFVPKGPKTPKAKKTTYSAEPTGTAKTPVSEGDSTMPRLAPEDLQEIVAAIAETPQFKWITSKMEEEQHAGAPGTEDDLGVEAEDEMDLGTEADVDEDEDLSDLDDLLGPDETAAETEDLAEPATAPTPEAGTEAEEPELEPEEKNRMTYTQKDGENAVVEKYAALQASHDRLMKDAVKMQTRIDQLERLNTDKDRKQRLEALHSKYSFVELEEECQKALYSLGGKMSDEQFDDRVATIEKYAEKAAAANVYIPEGDAPREQTPSVEKYAQDKAISERAVKIYSRELEKGNKLTYDEARDMAAKELTK